MIAWLHCLQKRFDVMNHMASHLKRAQLPLSNLGHQDVHHNQKLGILASHGAFNSATYSSVCNTVYTVATAGIRASSNNHRSSLLCNTPLANTPLSAAHPFGAQLRNRLPAECCRLVLCIHC